MPARTRPRSLIRIITTAVFLAIAFGLSPSADNRSTRSTPRTTATPAAYRSYLPPAHLAISVQTAQAMSDRDCRWSCTCNYWSDSDGKKSGPLRWHVEWTSGSPWQMES